MHEYNNVLSQNIWVHTEQQELEFLPLKIVASYGVRESFEIILRKGLTLQPRLVSHSGPLLCFLSRVIDVYDQPMSEFRLVEAADTGR